MVVEEGDASFLKSQDEEEGQEVSFGVHHSRQGEVSENSESEGECEEDDSSESSSESSDETNSNSSRSESPSGLESRNISQQEKIKKIDEEIKEKIRELRDLMAE